MMYLVAAGVLLLAYIAGINTLICRSVLRDAGAAQYRLDVLKLQAGLFTRLGRRNGVVTRRGQQEDDRGDQAGGDEFPHELMMNGGADS